MNNDSIGHNLDMIIDSDKMNTSLFSLEIVNLSDPFLIKFFLINCGLLINNKNCIYIDIKNREFYGYRQI